MQAKRLETLHDTTLCKVLQSSVDLQEEMTPATPEACVFAALLQIDLQRLFRQRLRTGRLRAHPDMPSMYGYTERVVHGILLYLTDADSPSFGRVMPMWHDEQLHLAEWQALQQLEYLFNLALSVDAKNLAIEKLKGSKKSATNEEPFDTIRSIHVADDNQLAEVAECEDDLAEIPVEEVGPDGIEAPSVTDQTFLLRLLNRTEEVELAKQPGQGQREALQCMRQAASIFGPMQSWRQCYKEPSALGADAAVVQNALVHHRDLLEELRETEDLAETP